MESESNHSILAIPVEDDIDVLMAAVTEDPVDRSHVGMVVAHLSSPDQVTFDSLTTIFDRVSLDFNEVQGTIEAIASVYDADETFLCQCAVINSDQVRDLSSELGQILVGEDIMVSNTRVMFHVPLTTSESEDAIRASELIGKDIRFANLYANIAGDEVIVELDAKVDEVYFISQSHQSCDGYAVVRTEDNVSLGCYESEIDAQDRLEVLLLEDARDDDEDLVRFSLDQSEVLDAIEDALTFGVVGDINTKPTQGMALAAEQGLRWYAEGYGGSGLEEATVQRARKIAQRENLTPAHIRRIKAFGDRHIPSGKKEQGWKRGQEGFPSPRRVASALWGHEAGWRWATKKVNEIERVESEGSATHTTFEVTAMSDADPMMSVLKNMLEVGDFSTYSPEPLEQTGTLTTDGVNYFYQFNGNSTNTKITFPRDEDYVAPEMPKGDESKCPCNQDFTVDDSEMAHHDQDDKDEMTHEVLSFGSSAQAAILGDRDPDFRGIVVLEGRPTGDGRIIDRGALSFRQLPLPLMFMDVNSGEGHSGSALAGVWTSLWREEYGDFNAIWGEGVFADNAAGAEARRLLESGMMRGISTDLDNISAFVEMSPEDPDSAMFRFTAARIIGNTFLSMPAFEEAAIWPTELVASGSKMELGVQTIVTPIEHLA